MSPLVSIIIPCYNKAQYLGETLESVEAQTHSNIEVIVVDDDSPDNTKEVASQYRQRMDNLQYIHQLNQGPSAARNNGIKASHGVYVMALDADDKLEPTYVEKCANYLQQHPEVKLVYSRADMFGQYNQPWDLPEYSHYELLWQNMINYCAMYRCSDFNQTLGYNINMVKGLEDWDFWLTFLNPQDKVHRIDEVLFHWRTQPVSRTAEAEENEHELMRQIYHNHEEIYAPYLQDIIYFHEKWKVTEKQFSNARQSKAYRLGKLLVRPIAQIKSKFQC